MPLRMKCNAIVAFELGNLLIVPWEHSKDIIFFVKKDQKGNVIEVISTQGVSGAKKDTSSETGHQIWEWNFQKTL